MEPDPILPAEQARIDRARAVSSDLEAIFADAVLPDPAQGRAARVRSFASARRGGLRAASIGALAAAGLAGLGAGAMMAPGKELAAAQSQTPVQVVTNEPLPAKAGYSGYPWSPEPYAPMQVGLPPPQPAQATPAVMKAVKAPRPKPAPKAASPCGRRCSYDEVMQADVRLRRAYFRAMDAGVSRSTLVSYRDRWSSLRRYGKRQPERLVSGYAVLTRDLTRAANRARRS